MISLKNSGKYSLVETVDKTKILTLDEKPSFAWVNAEGIGEILIMIKKKFTVEKILSVGTYRLYNVKNEKKLTDLEHLELFVGNGMWQGYLLPTGLPNGAIRKRIIATREIITKSFV